MKYVFFFLSILSFPAFSQNTLFVRAGATGNNTGASWAHAYTRLNDALAQAQPGDAVWVAEGTYFPTETGDRLASFNIPSGVGVYGGFTGTETALGQRDWQAHPTVLSGDIGVPGDSTDNACTIVYMDNPDSATVLDGVVLRYGNADLTDGAAPASPQVEGGALYIMAENGEAYARIAHCRFEHNFAFQYGGAVYVNGAGSGSVAPAFADCTFEYNKAGSDGGALYRHGCAWVDRPDFVGCRFVQNRAGRYGGALYVRDTERTDRIDVDSCLFLQNKSIKSGGGVYFSIGRNNGGRFWVRNTEFKENNNTALAVFFLFLGAPVKEGKVTGCVFDNNSEYNLGSTFTCCVYFDFLTLGNGQNELEIVGNIFKNNNSAGNSLLTIGTDGGVTSKVFNNIVSQCFCGALMYPNIKTNISNLTVKNSQFLTIIGSGLKSQYIMNQLFFDSSKTGVLLSSSSDHENYNISNITIVNSTIDKIVGAINTVNNSTIRLANSVVSNCTLTSDSYLSTTGATYYIDNCAFDLPICTSPQIICTDNLIGIDPLFVNPAQGDYHLQPCSPLLNAGNNALVPPELQTDLAGAPRIQGGTVDIGAFESAPPSLVAAPVVTPSCPGGPTGAIELMTENGCPPYTYHWETASGSGSSLEPLGIGQYAITVTDSKGSTFTVTATVPEGGMLNLQEVMTPVLCGDTLGGRASALPLSGTAPYAYSWAGYADADSLRTGLAAGVYPVTVTDVNGCSASGIITVTTTGGLEVQVTVGEISCAGATDGALTVLPANGKAPFTWHWDGGPATPVYEGLGAGIYAGFIEDAFGCRLNWVLPLMEPQPLAIQGLITSASDTLAADGAIWLDPVSGGTAPYAVLWSTGASGPAVGGLLPGMYTATVTDAHNCTVTGVYAVGVTVGAEEPDLPEKVHVYPNPFGAYLYVDVREPGAFRLYDALGRLVRVQALAGGCFVPTEQLPAGVYRWEWRLDDGVISWSRVVKGQ